MVALVALVACSSAPGHPDAPVSAWSMGPAMPRRVLEAAVASAGQRVVVVGGTDGAEVTARVDAFDPAENQWVALADAPVAWTSGNLGAVGGTLYLLGGLEGADRQARGEGFALDVLGQAWHPVTPMDVPYLRGAAGVATGPGHVYLLGGVSSTGPLRSCLEYDVAADRWNPLPDLPAPRAHPAVMRRSDGTLIVAGGFESIDASEPRSEVWALPPPVTAQLGWQVRRAPERVARGGCAYGVVLSQLICAGGQGDPSAGTLVESYDPYLDTWTDGEAMPAARAGTPGAALGARLYVPGGAEPLAAAPTDTLYIYAPLDTAPR
jgi:hypothetical protein